MKKMKLSLVVLSALLCGQVMAQKTGNPTLSLGGELAVPTGDLANTHKVGYGGSVKLAIPVITNGAFTLSAGYIHYTGKPVGTGKQTNINSLPFKAGFKYNLKGGVYLEPQLGYTQFNYPTPANGIKPPSYGAFTYAGNLGYMFNPNWDLALRFESANKNNTNINHVGLRLAYNFQL